MKYLTLLLEKYGKTKVIAFAVAIGVILTASIVVPIILLNNQEDCEHVYDNSCDSVCNKCEETRETTHSWVNASCDAPKTCSVCIATEGEKLKHSFTVDAYDDHFHFDACSLCGAADEQTKAKHVLDIENGTSSAQAMTEDTYDAEFACQCGAQFNANVYSDAIELYNKNDKLVKFLAYFDGELKYYIEYYYNKAGNVLNEERYGADDTLIDYVLYEYDKNEKLQKKSFYDTDENCTGYHLYEYDGDGKLIKDEDFNPDGTLDDVKTYEYDEKGNKKTVNHVEYNEDGSVDYTKVTEYYENGNINKQSFEYSDGSSQVYEYGENENIVKEIYTESDGYQKIREYDENENFIKYMEINPDGSKTIHEYYETGMLFKEIKVYSDGSQDINERDENGNVIKQTKVDAEGNETEICIHNYSDATCTTPKTCTKCKTTLGNALGHSPNSDDEDCTTAITCGTCGEITTAAKDAHTGGTATCTEKAVCIECNKAYGTVDANNHIDENTDHICDRECGNTDIGTHADSDEDNDHVCDYGCGVTLEDHKGGTATCLGYQCGVCGIWYGEKAPDNHASEEFTYTVNEDVYTHRKAHKCCDVTVIEAEAHDFVFETGKCKHCDAQAAVELRNYFEDKTFGYYFTMEDAFENIPDDGWAYAVYALTDYDADFTIPVNLINFFGESYRSVAIGTVLLNFNGTVINESYISGGVFNGKVINPGEISGGINTIFNGEVINEGTVWSGTFNGEVINKDLIRGGTFNGEVINEGTVWNGTFNGEVTNTGSITKGTFNGCIINNGHISNEQEAGTFTLGENFSIVNNGTIDCKYHIYKDGACRLCAYECDHSGTAHTTATDNGDGTHGFTCTVCGGYGTEDHKGGTATCVAQAVCTICGNGYGDLAPENHASTEFTYTNNGDGTHSSVCQYCGYVDTTTTEEHIYYIDENCKCSECGAEHYLPFVEEGNCWCDYCYEYIHNPGENCVCTICSIPVHTIDSTTGICSDCNTFVAAASITVDDVKTYYATFDEAIAYANGKDSTVIVIENDCDVMDGSTKFSSGSITIDLNGKTIGSHSGYSIPINGATVTIRDSVGGGKTLETVGGWSGTLIIEGGTHSYANNPKNLIITGGNFTHVGVNKDKTTISGGSFETISIHKNTGTFTDILADGYCFYDKDGKAVDVSTIQTDEYGWYYLYNVTVGAIK